MTYNFKNITDSHDPSFTRKKKLRDKYMKESHFLRMLQCIRSSDASVDQIERDYIIFVLMGNAGLRVSEVALLYKDDCKPLHDTPPAIDAPSLKKRAEKKDRKKSTKADPERTSKTPIKTIYVHPRVAKRILKYVDEHVYEHQKFLFPGSSGDGHMSSRQIRRIYTHYCKLFKEKYSTHAIRHMYGSMVYAKTKDLAFLRDQMGHARIEGAGVTNEYVHVEPKRIRALVSEIGFLL